MRNTRPIDKTQALRRLEALCAKAEHCESELRAKLRLWGIAPAEADDIVDCLRRNRYLDNTRFARAFVRDKFRFAGWGRLKIRAALRAKSLPAAVIDDAMQEIDPADYSAMLRSLVRKKIAAAPPEEVTPLFRRKIIRSLYARGFEPREIMEVLKC